MSASWMIYGAYGYTGELVARAAAKRGDKPLLAGRREERLKPLAEELGLDYRCVDLNDAEALRTALADVDIVAHCAGPFSETVEPMIEACLASHTHYVDITGELGVFDWCHDQHERAKAADIVVCPGVGFDVIPTDCLAACLHQAMPEATELNLAFDSRSGLSPGTAKTSVAGLKQGNMARREGKLVRTPLGKPEREIDFGEGAKHCVSIPWGDVATAYFTTGIPNVQVFVPVSPKAAKRLQRINMIRPLMGLGFVQKMLQGRIEKKVKGPSAEQRERHKTRLYGEAKDAQGEIVKARLTTANGYDVTVHGVLTAVSVLGASDHEPGYTTPSSLLGERIIETFPGSSKIEISESTP